MGIRKFRLNDSLDDDSLCNISESFDPEEEDKEIEELKVNSDFEKLIILKPTDVFRVPLAWMMPDSIVSIYLKKE